MDNTHTIEDVLKDFNKAINCLALELPQPVWNDVHFRWIKLQNEITASLNRQGWTRVDMPKDGTVIQRWHRLWECPVSVKYFPNKFAHEWVEATLSHSWPEESFTEDWMPLPNKPSI